jgi:hypothetical protein
MDLQRANLEKMAAKVAEAAAPIPEDSHLESDPAEAVNNTTLLQSDKPTDKPTDTQTNRQTDRQTVKPSNRPTAKPTVKPTVKQAPRQAAGPTPRAAPPETEESPRRADGRTMRVRQNTADRTMVTSLRLAVETVEALDEFCWSHRRRKQDVVQAALDLYFAAMDEEGR